MSNGYSTPPSSPPRGFRTPVGTPNGTPAPRGPLTLNSLKNLLNNTRRRWAFTGSQAMKIHGNSVGRTSRPPNDIDILVNANSLPSFVHALSFIGYRRSSATPLAGRKKIRKVTMNKGNKHIDLLVAGELGPTFRNNTVTRVQGFPVVTIPELITRKQNAGGNTAAANIAFLERLLRG